MVLVAWWVLFVFGMGGGGSAAVVLACIGVRARVSARDARHVCARAHPAQNSAARTMGNLRSALHGHLVGPVAGGCVVPH